MAIWHSAFGSRELWLLAFIIWQHLSFGNLDKCGQVISAGTLHASQGGGGWWHISMEVIVTIRLPSWYVPHSSSTPNVMPTSSSSSPPSVRSTSSSSSPPNVMATSPSSSPPSMREEARMVADQYGIRRLIRLPSWYVPHSRPPPNVMSTSSSSSPSSMREFLGFLRHHTTS